MRRWVRLTRSGSLCIHPPTELFRLLSPLHLQQGVWRVVRGPAQAALDRRERGEEVWP